MELSKKHIEQLLEKEIGKLKGTIYIPTHPKSTSQSIAKDRTRFKNALQVIASHHAYNERELGATMESLYALYDDVNFWKHQDLGLAILLGNDGYEYFNLPYEVTEAEYVTDHYVVSPMIIMLSIGTGFYVLDTNFTKPRLLYGSNGRLAEVNSKNMPEGFEDAVGRDEYRKHQQHHAGGGQFHGHGEDGALAEDERRYLTKIAEAVNTHLHDTEIPLLLSGTSNRTGNIRPMLTYANVLQNTLVGSFERHNETELFNECAEIIENLARGSRDNKVKELNSATPELVLMGAQEVAEGANKGRIDTLFLPAYKVTADTAKPGFYDSIILQMPSNIELWEPMVAQVLGQSGNVQAVEIDAYKVLDRPKALCRY